MSNYKTIVWIVGAEAVAITSFLFLVLNNFLINSVDVMHFFLNNHVVSMVLIGLFVIITSLVLFISYIQIVKSSNNHNEVNKTTRATILTGSIFVAYLVTLLTVNGVLQKHEQAYQTLVALVKTDICSAFDKPVGRQPIDIVRGGNLKNKAFETFRFKKGWRAINDILHGFPELNEKEIENKREALNSEIEDGCVDLRKAQFS